MWCLTLACFLSGYLQITRETDIALDKILKSTDIITELNPRWTWKGERIVEGDIVVPNYRESKETNELEDRKAIVNVLTLWYNGMIAYNFHSSVEPDTRENIKRAIEHWEERTCLRFSERMFDLAYLRFRSDTAGCWSFIGRSMAPFTPQDVSIGKGCNHVHIIAHEIGHAIGFYHEQSRNDRYGFVDILWNNMDAGKYSQFDVGMESARGVLYDYTSVMHYGPMAFSSRMFEKNTIVAKNPHFQRLVGGGRGLSFRDGKLANVLYSCNAGCPNPGDESKCQNGGYLGPYRRDRQPCTCVCPPETTGETCETVIGHYYAESPCGGNITEEAEIQTPGYPKRCQSVNDGCTWWIQAPPNMRPQVEFMDFSFYPRFEHPTSSYSGKCVVERVEIRTYDRNDGEMFCGEDIPPGTVATSRTPDFIIIINRNPDRIDGRGLRAKVSFVPIKTNSTEDASDQQLQDIIADISSRLKNKAKQ